MESCRQEWFPTRWPRWTIARREVGPRRHRPPDHEERALRALGLEDVEDRNGGRGVGPVVEGQGDLVGMAGAVADLVAEPGTGVGVGSLPPGNASDGQHNDEHERLPRTAARDVPHREAAAPSRRRRCLPAGGRLDRRAGAAPPPPPHRVARHHDQLRPRLVREHSGSGTAMGFRSGCRSSATGRPSLSPTGSSPGSPPPWPGRSAGDWIVTLWLVLGIAGLLAATFVAFPGAAARLVGGHATSQPGAGGSGADRADALHLGGRAAPVGGRRLAAGPSGLGGGPGCAGPDHPSRRRRPAGPRPRRSPPPVRTGRRGQVSSPALVRALTDPDDPRRLAGAALPRLRGELDGREAGQLRHHAGPPLPGAGHPASVSCCSCAAAPTALEGGPPTRPACAAEDTSPGWGPPPSP